MPAVAVWTKNTRCHPLFLRLLAMPINPQHAQNLLPSSVNAQDTKKHYAKAVVYKPDTIADAATHVMTAGLLTRNQPRKPQDQNGEKHANSGPGPGNYKASQDKYLETITCTRFMSSREKQELLKCMKIGLSWNRALELMEPSKLMSRPPCAVLVP